MEVPGIGQVERDDEFGWLRSPPLPVGALGGHRCEIVLDGYEEDSNQEDFHAAIASLRSSERDLLSEAEPHVFRYYQDVSRTVDRGDPDFVAEPYSVWEHVQLGSELRASRRRRADHAVYVSLECNCDWEPEHGLQLVFKEGRVVVKVGPYDGHLTNADAFGDPTLEGTIYKRRQDGGV